MENWQTGGAEVKTLVIQLRGGKIDSLSQLLLESYYLTQIGDNTTYCLARQRLEPHVPCGAVHLGQFALERADYLCGGVQLQTGARGPRPAYRRSEITHTFR